MKKGNNWLHHEDAAFRQIYLEQPTQKWKDVSCRLAIQYGIQKSPKQCRQRFKNHLDPSLSKELWSPEETAQLLELHHQMGNQWAAISRRLPGRNDNSVKNKLYSLYRHSISSINKAIRNVGKDRFKQISMGFIIKFIALIDSKFRQGSLLPEEVISQADILKVKIIQFNDVSEAHMAQLEAQLPELVARVQFINQQFKKKAVKIKKRKSSSSKVNSFLPIGNKQTTEHQQAKEKSCQKQKNKQVAVPEVPDQKPLLVIPFGFDRIYIGGLPLEDEDLWEDGWKDDDSQPWICDSFKPQ